MKELEWLLVWNLGKYFGFGFGLLWNMFWYSFVLWRLNKTCQLLNLLLVWWISVFQKSAEARIRTTLFVYKCRDRSLWRNWQWQVCLSRIVYPEVHWSLDREIIRILFHQDWTIASMLMLSPTKYMQTKLNSIRSSLNLYIKIIYWMGSYK